jgi:hypothetical protein
MYRYILLPVNWAGVVLLLRSISIALFAKDLDSLPAGTPFPAFFLGSLISVDLEIYMYIYIYKYIYTNMVTDINICIYICIYIYIYLSIP